MTRERGLLAVWFVIVAGLTFWLAMAACAPGTPDNTDSNAPPWLEEVGQSWSLNVVCDHRHHVLIYYTDDGGVYAIASDC